MTKHTATVSMIPLTPESRAVFDHLVADLAIDDSRSITQGPAIEPLAVSRITETETELAHYSTMNGDAMVDPSMSFWRSPDDQVYPISWRNDYAPFDERAVEFDEAGQVTSCATAQQREMAEYANGWLQRIKARQRLAKPYVTP